MRFAFISDIHGNLHALDLVLADLQHTQVDHLVCLGDIASLGPQPREVIARLRQLQTPIIMGNHENYLLNPQLTETHSPWLRAAELWCLAQLTAEDMNYLSSFPAQLSFAVSPNKSLLCFHGSPRSNEEFLYPTTPSEVFEELFSGQPASLFIGGHTHVQMVRQHKSATLINPGSVGMPFEFPRPGSEQHGLRRAEYAIVDITDDRLTVNLHQLPIDFDYLAQVARASGLPDVELWLSTWSV
ncbi:MAG: metallophosphoesterase family protein [Chloroflexota bacterium]